MRFSRSSITETIAGWNIKKIAMQLVAAGLVIALVSSIFWYKDVYMTDERRFWSAVDNSMSTSSVVRTLTSGGTGNQVVQKNRFYFTPVDINESMVAFDNRTATASTSVVTEGINTLDSQYSRYVSFETTDAREDGSIPSLDNVLGKWAGETLEGEEALEQARLNYVSELVTLVVFGNFTQDVRSDVVNALKDSNAYDVGYTAVTEDIVDGEEVLYYPVSVGLRAYAQQLQDSFKRAGLGEFPPLNPENYSEDSRISAQFTVRKRDNAITSIDFGDRSETYSNYGVQKNVEIPSPEYTPQELEAQVQKEIQG